MKTICRYKDHKRSRSSKLKLMQKYVNAYVFILIVLNLSNGTFIIRIYVFYFTAVVISDCWGQQTQLLA
jgi:hypothetical protein